MKCFFSPKSSVGVAFLWRQQLFRGRSEKVFHTIEKFLGKQERLLCDQAIAHKTVKHLIISFVTNCRHRSLPVSHIHISYNPNFKEMCSILELVEVEKTMKAKRMNFGRTGI